MSMAMFFLRLADSAIENEVHEFLPTESH